MQNRMNRVVGNRCAFSSASKVSVQEYRMRESAVSLLLTLNEAERLPVELLRVRHGETLSAGEGDLNV